MQKHNTPHPRCFQTCSVPYGLMGDKEGGGDLFIPTASTPDCDTKKNLTFYFHFPLSLEVISFGWDCLPIPYANTKTCPQKRDSKHRTKDTAQDYEQSQDGCLPVSSVTSEWDVRLCLHATITWGRDCQTETRVCLVYGKTVIFYFLTFSKPEVTMHVVSVMDDNCWGSRRITGWRITGTDSLGENVNVVTWLIVLACISSTCLKANVIEGCGFWGMASCTLWLTTVENIPSCHMVEDLSYLYIYSSWKQKAFPPLFSI